MAISIETAQNVIIEQPIASVGNRIVSHLIDFVFKVLYVVLILIILGLIGVDNPFYYLMFLPIVFYSVLSETFFNGQSPGKMITKLRVVRLDGLQPTLGNLLLRWVCRIVDLQFAYGAVATLVIAFNGKSQRLGDLAAGTTVVLLKAPQTLYDTVFRTLPENYIVQFSEVAALTEKDIQTTHNVLLSIKSSSRNSVELISVAFKAKMALEKKMGVKTELAPVEFLDTVINDYNYHYRLMG